MTGKIAHDALEQVVYSDEPVLLLFGQDEEGLAVARDAAARAGCRIAAEAGIEGAPERLDSQIQVDAALVVAQAPSNDLDRLLDRLDASGRTGRMRSVVVAPQAMIDVVTARCFTLEVDHQIDPDRLSLQLAIAGAAAPAPARLHDVTRANGVGVLQQLSEEAARIASVLAALSEEGRGGRIEAVSRDLGEAPPVDAAFVRSIIRARRMRDQFLRGGLFADPAWDMLLDLMAARLEGGRVAVSSLCIAAAVPATTALRWVKALTERGLFVRAADPQDGRRVYIELSEDAARAMSHYLAAVQRTGAVAV